MEMIKLCQMVARSLIAEIGPWGNRCVLFGGLIPGLLVPDPEEPLLPHIGTRDVDLAIRVAVLGDDADMYRTLKNNLKALKLEQSSNPSFEWTRMVEGTRVVVELFVPVDTPDQAGNIQRKPIEKSGSDLTALGIYGLDLIERDVLEIDNEGPLLEGKGIKAVKLRVCGPAMLIALKAWALKERTKTKDGYDTDFGQQALTHLAECFKTHEHTGPGGWVIESNFEGDERIREMREAAGIVQEFTTLVQTLPGRETGREESSDG